MVVRDVADVASFTPLRVSPKFRFQLTFSRQNSRSVGQKVHLDDRRDPSCEYGPLNDAHLKIAQELLKRDLPLKIRLLGVRLSTLKDLTVVEKGIKNVCAPAHLVLIVLVLYDAGRRSRHWHSHNLRERKWLVLGRGASESSDYAEGSVPGAHLSHMLQAPRS